VTHGQKTCFILIYIVFHHVGYYKKSGERGSKSQSGKRREQETKKERWIGEEVSAK